MQVQICRQCGKQNVVVSGPLSKCIFCDSSDLGEIVNYNSQDSSEESGFGLKAVAAVVVVLGLSVGGYFAWQSLNSNSSNKLEMTTASNTPKTVNATANSATAPHSNTAANQQLTQQNSQQLATNSTGSEQASTQADKPLAEGSNTFKSSTSNSQVVLADNPETSAGTQSLPATANRSIEKNSNASTGAQVTSNNNIEKQRPDSANNSVNKKAVEATQKSTDNKLTEKKAKAVAKPKPVKAPVVSQKPKAKVVQKTKPKPQPKSKPIAKPKPKPVQSKAVAKAAQPSEKQVSKTPVKAKPIDYKKRLSERQKLRVLNSAKGVVLDSKTGLMWMTCSLGQTWGSGRCSGEADQYFWSEAVNLAKETNYANYSDWRLPTRKELHSIVDCTNGRIGYQLGADGKMLRKKGVLQNGKCLPKFSSPTIDIKRFKDTPAGMFWTYNHSAQKDYSAWAVFFSSGYQYDYNTSNEGYVRLVRTYSR